MERSSPAQTAGVCIRRVTIGGVEYTLSNPDRVRKAADEEAVICSRRKMPQGLSLEQQKIAIELMVSGIATPQEWSSYWNSGWKLAFRFWNALDDIHKMTPGDPGDARLRRPPMPPRRIGLVEGVEWAYELFSSDDRTGQEIEDAWLAIRAVSQEELLKNSSGCQQPGTPQTDTLSTAVGQQSTSSSPSAV